MILSKPWLAVAVAACAFTVAAPLQASVVIAGTRIIYDQKEREVTVRLMNQGQLPGLVQAWIDDGDEKADPATIKVPFTLSPPMVRIEPDKGQSLRLIYTQAPLPADKESVFWLNVLEVQPRPKTPDVNMLLFAYRTRIKLFFRPSGLAGKPEDAPAKLQWSVGTDPKGGRILHVSNPTAYHVSFSGTGVTIGGVDYGNHDGGMVNPGASADFPMKPEKDPVPATSPRDVARPVHFSWINDYGSDVAAQAPLEGGS